MYPSSPHIFEAIVSKPRLDSYKGYFHVKSTDEAIGLYMWNLELATCFGSLLSLFEIALRNNIHSAMSHFYTRGGSVSDHWYDKISASLKPETLSKIAEVRYQGPHKARVLRNPAPGPDEIVSRVSFGFWPGILSVIDKRYAAQIFPKIFPNHPMNANASNWQIDRHRKHALSFIYELNQFRNRIAHHEPLWKFAAVMDTSVRPPRVLVPASSCYADSEARMQRLLGFFDAAVSALNQDFYLDLLQSSWRVRLNYLLSARGFMRYKTLKYKPSPYSITPTEFRQAFPRIVKANRPIRLKRSDASGLFIPD
jgi:Abi-like protein